MPEPVLTPEQMLELIKALARNTPAALDEAALPELPQIVSLRAEALTTGLVLRLAAAGAAPIDVVLSPPAALRLWEDIAVKGFLGGWLDEDMALTSGPRRALDS